MPLAKDPGKDPGQHRDRAPRRAKHLDQFPATARTTRRPRHHRGNEDYKMRARTVEPAFGQLKTCQKLTTMSRRGLTASESEWLLACTAHNLGKLHLPQRLQARRHFDDMITTGQAAADAAHHAGDQQGEVAARNSLGTGLQEVRRFDEAITAHQQALAFFAELEPGVCHQFKLTAPEAVFVRPDLVDMRPVLI